MEYYEDPRSYHDWVDSDEDEIEPEAVEKDEPWDEPLTFREKIYKRDH